MELQNLSMLFDSRNTQSYSFEAQNLFLLSALHEYDKKSSLLWLHYNGSFLQKRLFTVYVKA